MNSNFKQLLIELDNLSRQAKASVYRRAQLVVALIRDPEYAEYLRTDDEGQVRSQLRRYIAELNVTVDDLIVMLDFAPDQDTWDKTPLRDLCADAYANRMKRGQPGRPPKKSEKLVEKLRQKIATLTEQLHQERAKNRDLARRLHAIEKSLTGV